MSPKEQELMTITCSKPKSASIWTEQEEQTLIQLYSNHSNKHISQILNKTKASVDQKASNLGLKKSSTHRKKVSLLNNQKKRHAWTDDEITYLKKNYESQSYEAIADSLQRTANAVSQKARQLCLKKYRKTIQQIQDEANLKFPFIKE